MSTALEPGTELTAEDFLNAPDERSGEDVLPGFHCGVGEVFTANIPAGNLG